MMRQSYFRGLPMSKVEAAYERCASKQLDLHVFFGAEIGTFLENLSISHGANPTFLLPVILNTFSSAAGIHACLRIKDEADTYPNLNSLIVGWENSGKTVLIQNVFRRLFETIKKTYPTSDHWYCPNRENLVSKLKRSAGAASCYVVDDLKPFQENVLRKGTRQSAADVLEDLFSSTSGKKQDAKEIMDVSLSFLATMTPPSACAFYRLLHEEDNGMDRRTLLFSGPQERLHMHISASHPNGEEYVYQILENCLTKVIERHRPKHVNYRLSKEARTAYGDFVKRYSLKMTGDAEADANQELRRQNTSPHFATLVKKLILAIYLTKQAMEAVFFKRNYHSDVDWHFIPEEVVDMAVVVFEVSEDHWFNYLLAFIDEPKGEPIPNRGLKRPYIEELGDHDRQQQQQDNQESLLVSPSDDELSQRVQADQEIFTAEHVS